MFLIAEPNEESIAQFLESQKGKPFSYTEVGVSRNGNAPNSYNVDHNRVRLGTGRAAFDRAIEAVQSWKMFDLTWTRLYRNDTPLEVGATVVILIKHFGFWSVNAAQIVYVFEENNAVEKFGFAYGTLTEHGERGEERFSVEYHKAEEAVWYDLYAFSRPNHFLAKFGYPVSRYLQKRFAIESKQAMVRAVQK